MKTAVIRTRRTNPQGNEVALHNYYYKNTRQTGSAKRLSPFVILLPLALLHNITVICLTNK